jgi:hypothetical protein
LLFSIENFEHGWNYLARRRVWNCETHQTDPYGR